MVNGALLWETNTYEARLDKELETLSHFTANIMLSSGNYKKNTKIEKIREALYIPIADREAFMKKHGHAEGKPTRSQNVGSPEKLSKLFEKFDIDM